MRERLPEALRIGLDLSDVERACWRASRKRVGRGNGSGRGTTCGRGTKGQKSRSGGYHKVGFEGGQMPLQRRLPKIGFRSRNKNKSAEVRLDRLAAAAGDTFDLEALRDAKLVSRRARRAKIIASGKIERAISVRGVAVSAGARHAIAAAGGKVE